MTPSRLQRDMHEWFRAQCQERCDACGASSQLEMERAVNEVVQELIVQFGVDFRNPPPIDPDPQFDAAFSVMSLAEFRHCVSVFH